MAVLNINQISVSLMNIVKDLVGYRLSTIPLQNGTTPSVILNRSGTPKPDFPYGIIDHIGLVKIGYAQRASYLDANEDEVDEFDYKGRFLIQFNGGVSDDVLSICSELKDRLFTSKGKRSFSLRTQGIDVGILSVSDISFIPTRLSTDFEEVARLTIDLSLRSVIVDETAEVIENIDVEGNLYVDLEDKTNPLTTQTIVP